MNKSYAASVALLLIFCGTTVASAESTFTFESVVTLDNMTSLVRAKFPLGTSRADLRRAFVEEGHATLKVKAGESHVEKYLYDIDLCQYYIWRWNISADYDTNNQLRQAYINGNLVFPNGNPKKIISKVAEKGRKASIFRVQRPRPEARKGESSLGFLLFDRDSDPKTTDDQALMGFGPSRGDPMDMGKRVAYTDVEPWRSIFDFDAADRIVPHQGNCKEVDRLIAARKR